MAFSFANVAAGLGAGSGVQTDGVHVADGPELQESITQELGFAAMNGEAKVRLLPSPWPVDALPIPSASLLSIASSQQLVAAAGPDALIIASTDDIRNAIYSTATKENIRDLTPLLQIRHLRLAHVAFSSDESVLAVSEQQGTEIIAYRVEDLKQGRPNVALRISIPNSLRSLVANPAPEQAQFFAAVTQNGDLLIADFSTGTLAQGNNGAILKSGVSCVSWSNKGKAIVAGLGDGTAVQIKPDGSVMALIPKSTSIPDDHHVSNITWLENDAFFVVYTPNEESADNGIPPSEYYIINREPKTTNYAFQKLPELLPPFGVERLPTFHFVTRLRNFPPHLQDLLLVSGTTSTDVAMVAKSSEPLAKETPVIDTFTMVSVMDDTSRAQLPLSSESLDTSPIGMGIDLSSKEGIVYPIKSDPEIEISKTSVPLLLVLNNEGIVCSWGVIYNESVRRGTMFSGFETLKTLERTRALVKQKPALEVSTTTQPPIAQQTFGSAFSKPRDSSTSILGSIPSTVSPFTEKSASPAFGQSGFGTGSNFGKPSPIGGEAKTSWTSTGFGSGNKQQDGSTAFGKPAFGSPAPLIGNNGPAFGQTGFAAGNASTPVSAAPAFGSIGFGTTGGAAFGKPSFGSGASTTTTPTAPAFGSPGFGSAGSAAFGKPSFGAAKAASAFTGTNASSASPFGTVGNAPASSGFASFAGGTGFGSNQNDQNSKSPFAAKSDGSSIFSQPVNQENSFGPSKLTSFSAQPEKQDTPSVEKSNGFTFANQSTNSFASPTTTSLFGDLLKASKITSTFQRDGCAKDDLPKPTSGGFGFGTGFAGLLDETTKGLSPTHDKEEEMGDDRADEVKSNLVTPPATIGQPKATPAPPVFGLFGQPKPETTTPQTSQPATEWGLSSMPSTTPKDTPAPMKILFGTKPIVEPTPAAVQTSVPMNTFEPPEEQQDEGLKIKEELQSDDDVEEIRRIPEAPLPPDPYRKPMFGPAGTADSSLKSTDRSPDEESIPESQPANKSAESDECSEPALPDDDEGFSSDFDGSGEDVTGEISPVEEPEDEKSENDDKSEGDEHAEQVQTSPESSFNRSNDKSLVESPTGGLFTKVSAVEQPKPTRPLFGEVGGLGHVLPPPIPQSSPRSPSPVRKHPPSGLFGGQERSVSAPAQPRSLINQRKVEYQQSSVAAEAMRAREEETLREKIRLEAIQIAKAEAKAQEEQALEHDEGEIIQQELLQPLEPSDRLDAFMAYQAGNISDTAKTDIPGQIERLYQDINSMVLTIGMNARTLSAYMLYQQSQPSNEDWPSVLASDTPMDTLNDEWVLEDIRRLHEGQRILGSNVESVKVEDLATKIARCNRLVTESEDLKGKFFAMRKTANARIKPSNGPDMPLSAEQVSLQQDLRKSSVSVQTKLAEVEDNLAVLKAKLVELRPSQDKGKRQSTPKKPTVEAVINTVTKMTSMAEKKSADVDVLEAKLRRLGVSSEGIALPNTPRGSKMSYQGITPKSAGSSVYHTPKSKAGGSARSTPSRKALVLVTNDDRDKWQAKSRRKKDVVSVLRKVLEERQTKASR